MKPLAPGSSFLIWATWSDVSPCVAGFRSPAQADIARFGKNPASRGTDQAANSIALKVSRAGDASQDRIAASLEKRHAGGKGRASPSTSSA